MAYPYQITNTANLPYPFGCKPIRRANGDLYIVVNDEDSPGIQDVFRSTDQGVIWTVQDAADNPTTLDESSYHGNVADDGTTIWQVFSPGGGPTPPTESYVQGFNTTTNQWSSAITGGPAAIITPAVTTSLSADANLGLSVRSTGDKVVVYTEYVAFGGANYTSLKAKVYNGTSWSSAINVCIPGTTESGVYMNYTFMGMVLGGSDRIHVFAATFNGLVHAIIKSDNTVSNYQRFDNETIDTGVHREGFWGLPSLVTLGDTDFAMLPIGAETTFNGAVNSVYPGIFLIEDSLTPGAARWDYVNEQVRRRSNWVSITATQDPSTESIYLLWTRVDVADESTELRMACSNGFGWSAVSAFWESASGGLIENLEIAADDGTMRVVFSNSDGDAPYLWPNYYQAAVTCAVAGCPDCIGITPLPETADLPLPPIWPRTCDLYGREHLNQNLKLYREDDLIFQVTITRNGLAIDITGATFALTAKWDVTDADASAVFTCSSSSDGIALTDPTNGVITITVSSAKTTSIPSHIVELFYDVQMILASERSTVLYGKIKIFPDITTS